MVHHLSELGVFPRHVGSHGLGWIWTHGCKHPLKCQCCCVSLSSITITGMSISTYQNLDVAHSMCVHVVLCCTIASYVRTSERQHDDDDGEGDCGDDDDGDDWRR